MALSEDALTLLSLLRHDDRASNIATLKSKLGREDGEYEAIQQELLDSGVVELQGRGRLARTRAAADTDLTPEATMLLTALPADGSMVGNYSVRGRLELDDETYAVAKRELREAGLIRVGVGYGGTVGRAAAVPGAKEAEETPPSAPGLVRKEEELYRPFADWLRSSLADQGLQFAEAKITARPKGYKRSSGRWSRPDVTAVQVFRYEWLPEITVEVSTYEIKQAADATKLESVYEAAAHGRWAHRASLVVEQVDGTEAVPEPVFDEVRRFRLGLYAMRRKPDGSFEVRELIQPPLTHESQPEDLNDLLGYFLGEDVPMRRDYRRAIGQ